jgi:hypothetical protein
MPEMHRSYDEPWKVSHYLVTASHLSRDCPIHTGQSHIDAGGELVVLDELPERLEEVAHQTNGDVAGIARMGLSMEDLLLSRVSRRWAVPAYVSRYKGFGPRGGIEPPTLRFSSACSAN